MKKERILSKLDGYLYKNDYTSAKRHLEYWLADSVDCGDSGCEILVRNELMGLCRKLGEREEALEHSRAALEKIKELGLENTVGSATTYINCATVHKAFGLSSEAMPLFERAREIYESNLDNNDTRLGGLYNNMALALVDVGRFPEATELYRKALSVMESTLGGEPEAAITYLNIASALEEEAGIEYSGEAIAQCLAEARKNLENAKSRDGHYAFVCEKCAPVFEHYGDKDYGDELADRARRIYNEGS